MNPIIKTVMTESAAPQSGNGPAREVGSAVYRRDDPMRRFIPTPHSASLPVMGRTVRLESNCPRTVRHMVGLFSRYPAAPKEDPEFLWRIVVESDAQVRPPWPRRFGFSDDGLQFVTFGQRTFLATNLEAREGIAVLSSGLAEDELGFTTPFLDNLFCLTAGSLGLVPLWANCVSGDQRGVLLFGRANSGKTSAGFAAEKLGLDFHADDGAFIEVENATLRSWSGFWPALFRSEALQFFPELRECARACVHQDFTVYYRARQIPQGTLGLPVKPVCCLFLERESAMPHGLSRISRQDLQRHLAEYVLFHDDTRFDAQQANVLRVLAELPAYTLRYASDPTIVAATARGLLAS